MAGAADKDFVVRHPLVIPWNHSSVLGSSSDVTRTISLELLTWPLAVPRKTVSLSGHRVSMYHLAPRWHHMTHSVARKFSPLIMHYCNLLVLKNLLELHVHDFYFTMVFHSLSQDSVSDYRFGFFGLDGDSTSSSFVSRQKGDHRTVRSPTLATKVIW